MRKVKNKKLSYARYGYYFSIPFAVAFLLFTLYPILYTVIIGFTDLKGLGMTNFHFLADDPFRNFKVVLTSPSFKQALYFKEIGFCLYDTMIYQKVNYVPLTHRRYEQAFEYMFVLTKGKPKTFNPIVIPCKNAGKLESYGLERRRSIDAKQSMRSPEGITYKATKETKIHPNIFPYTLGKSRTGHPAPFPCELAHDMVYSWSNEGDVVLDPFMGSGTTALECVKLHRHFLGFEISEEYVKMATDRVKAIQPPDYLTYDT